MTETPMPRLDPSREWLLAGARLARNQRIDTLLIAGRRHGLEDVVHRYGAAATVFAVLAEIARWRRSGCSVEQEHDLLADAG